MQPAWRCKTVILIYIATYVLRLFWETNHSFKKCTNWILSNLGTFLSVWPFTGKALLTYFTTVLITGTIMHLFYLWHCIRLQNYLFTCNSIINSIGIYETIAKKWWNTRHPSGFWKQFVIRRVMKITGHENTWLLAFNWCSESSLAISANRFTNLPW